MFPILTEQIRDKMSFIKDEITGYTPKDYSLEDYSLYRYYTAIQNGVPKQSNSARSSTVTAIKSPSTLAFEELCSRFFAQMQASVPHNSNVKTEIENTRKTIAQDPKKHDPLFVQSQLSIMDLYGATKECIEIYRAFMNSLETIHLSSSNENLYDPNEFSPVSVSFYNLASEWTRCTGDQKLNSFHDQIKSDIESQTTTNLEKYLQDNSTDQNIAAMTFQNLQLIFSPNYHQQCIDRLEGNAVLTPKKARGVTSQHSNPSFMMAVYSDPRFQSRYFQLLLLAIIITAALVAAAFLVKASLLPVAVATMVKGLSQYATPIIVSSAAMGIAAAGTLYASLRARSFFGPGGAGNAGSSANFEMPQQLVFNS